MRKNVDILGLGPHSMRKASSHMNTRTTAQTYWLIDGYQHSHHERHRYYVWLCDAKGTALYELHSSLFAKRVVTSHTRSLARTASLTLSKLRFRQRHQSRAGPRIHMLHYACDNK